MLSKDKIVDWLWENCRDENNDLVLNYLDLTRFDDVYFNCNKVRGTLYQDNQEVGESLYQDCQKVGEFLCQSDQKVNGNLHQSRQTVDGNLHQTSQKVKGEFYNHKLKENEYWEEDYDYIFRKKKLKEISLEELAQMGYKLKL